ncbi:MAG: hypothetical protein ACFB51_18240 [Anaerolineae bacterium]
MAVDEKRMPQEAREKSAAAPVMCMSCGQSFSADLWLPWMRCPHCDTIGYPDHAGFHLMPLNWLCQECGHDNDGLTNFCVNCGAGLVSRCTRCESPVYAASCTVCGTLQQPILQRIRMAQYRDKHFQPVRSRVIVKKVQQEAAIRPAARHNPTYGVAGWRQINPSGNGKPQPPQEEDQPAGGQWQTAPTATTSGGSSAQTAPAKKRTNRTWPSRIAGLFWIIVGLAFLLASESGAEPLGWENGTPLDSIITLYNENTAEIWLGITAVGGLIAILVSVRLFRRISEQLFP